MKHFHSHIYFEPSQLESAHLFGEKARLSNLFEVVELSEHPIGPHPLGMVEVHFHEHGYSEALEWLHSNRAGLSALVHEDTGDDFKDHTLNIHWFGKVVPLDFKFFELIQVHPELRIHP